MEGQVKQVWERFSLHALGNRAHRFDSEVFWLEAEQIFVTQSTCWKNINRKQKAVYYVHMWCIYPKHFCFAGVCYSKLNLSGIQMWL